MEYVLNIICQMRVSTDWFPKSNRFHVAREKRFSSKRNNMSLTSFFLFTRTERLDRVSGTNKSRLMEMDTTLDGGEH